MTALLVLSAAYAGAAVLLFGLCKAGASSCARCGEELGAGPCRTCSPSTPS